MNTKSSVLAVCLAIGFSAVATSTEAGFKDRHKQRGSNKSVVSAPPSAPAIRAPAPGRNTPSLPGAKYPNGLGWRAIENDFIDVKARIDVVESKVDDVKADTVSILHELDDVDADHVTIMNQIDALDTELGNVAADVLAISSDVATLKNTLQVQVSIEPESAADRNDVNDAPVGVFVQVTQNGVGVAGLTPDTFLFSSSFPAGGAGYCGTNACFTPGMDGMYRIELAGDWVAGTYAGTLTVLEGSTTAVGTSLVTFDIPAEPVSP